MIADVLSREIRCGEPILSSPVVANDRIYFATLGSQVYAIAPDGTVHWKWDYVKEHLDFHGDRWSGEAWLKHKRKRVRWSDLFTCSMNLAVMDKTVVLPAGGLITWLKDAGDHAVFVAVDRPCPKDSNAHFTTRATFGLSIGPDGRVYRQTHRLDNGGRVEILSLAEDRASLDAVPGTKSSTGGGLLGFSSVSLRGNDVYRCRIEPSFGMCVHRAESGEVQTLGSCPSIASPILLRNSAVYGGIRRKPLRRVAQRRQQGVVVSDRIRKSDHRAGCCLRRAASISDAKTGYLYALSSDGKAPLPTKEMQLWKVRSPLTSKFAGAEYDRFTTFGNWQSTNYNQQGLELPLKVKWIRRYEGTTKHFSTCGGGRMYTHTAEGMVFAVEQETGRLLWRRYWPGAFLSYTSPSYHKERLIVPQAGPGSNQIRCLDAATGKLLWSAPFSGSPNWNRQLAPIVHDNLVFYQFSTGKFERRRSADAMSWLNNYGQRSYPASHKPLVRAWNLQTGEEAWTRDFSVHGSGGDEAGLVLMDGVLYYSCFFGNEAGATRPIKRQRYHRGHRNPNLARSSGRRRNIICAVAALCPRKTDGCIWVERIAIRSPESATCGVSAQRMVHSSGNRSR